MIIVNFATKAFYAGQDRLKASLNGQKSLMFRDRLPGCPHHSTIPYEFKIHAIEQAWRRDDIVLWADASFYLVGDLSKIENLIQTDGYFMSEAGAYVRDWCNGRARDYFKLKPEEDGLIMFSAGLLGLNKKSPIAMEYFKQWKAAAKAGAFKGHRHDHRHDQTCGSIIAQRLGMKYQKGHTHMCYISPEFGPPDPEAVFHLNGIA